MTTPTERPFIPFIIIEQDHNGYRIGGDGGVRGEIGGKGENHWVINHKSHSSPRLNTGS